MGIVYDVNNIGTVMDHISPLTIDSNVWWMEENERVCVAFFVFLNHTIVAVVLCKAGVFQCNLVWL